MDNESFDLTALLALVLASFAYLGWTYRTSNTDDFHTAKRQAGITRIISSLFTVVGASEFVVFTTLTYLYGRASLVFFLGAFMGFLALAGLTPIIRNRASELDVHSIPDFARAQGMPALGVALTAVSVLFTGALVVIQIIIGGLLIDQITGAGFTLTAVLLTAAVVAYLAWGGYRALLYTDVVQAVVLFLFSAGLLWFLWRRALSLPSTEPLLALSEVPLDILGLAAGGFFAIFGGPEIWQRILTCQSTSAARAGLATSGFVMLAWGWFIVLSGSFIHRMNPSANENDAFFVFLASDLPDWLTGGILIALLAAILSTADTELFAATVMLRKQLQHGARLEGILRTRVVLLVVAAVALGASLLTQEVIDIYFWLVYLTFISGPVAFTLLMRRGGRRSNERKLSIGSAFIFSAGVFSFLWLKGLLVSWYPIVIALVAALPLALPRESSNLSSSSPQGT